LNHYLCKEGEILKSFIFCRALTQPTSMDHQHHDHKYGLNARSLLIIAEDRQRALLRKLAGTIPLSDAWSNTLQGRSIQPLLSWWLCFWMVQASASLRGGYHKTLGFRWTKNQLRKCKARF